MPVPADLLASLEELLQGSKPPPWDEVLALLLRRFDCAVGTVHLLDDGGLLQLAAWRGLPPTVLELVRTIPVGKGMAGIAAQRRAPVQVCNLQTDASGVVRPGARETRMEGSLACPMLDGGELRGVLGIAKPVAYEFSPAETELLLRAGERLARASA